MLDANQDENKKSSKTTLILILVILLILSFYSYVILRNRARPRNDYQIGTINNKTDLELIPLCKERLVEFYPEMENMEFKTYYTITGIGNLPGRYLVNATSIESNNTFGNIVFSFSGEDYKNFDGCHFLIYNPTGDLYNKIKDISLPTKLDCGNGNIIRYELNQSDKLNMLAIDIRFIIGNQSMEKFMIVFSKRMDTIDKILKMNIEKYGC